MHPACRRRGRVPVGCLLYTSDAADDGTPDAFTAMTFDSVEDFETFLGSPQMGAIAEDNDKFIGKVESYTIDHSPVIAG